MDSLPTPWEVVLERQSSPAYFIRESRRKPGFYAQIVCTVKGEGFFRKGNQTTRLTRGKAFMHVLGTPDISYGYPQEGNEPWEFIWFSFSGAPGVTLMHELNERYGYTFDLPLDRGFVTHLESFYSMRDTIQIVSPSAGAKIVYDAIAALGESLEQHLADSLQANLVKDVQKMILSNLDRTLDIAKIAEQLHLSREHLTRVFHSQTGQSPGQFALECRMRAASRLLHDNKLNCKEIAERLGYVSASSFARVFRQFYSVSPAEYRKRPAELIASFRSSGKAILQGAEPDPYHPVPVLKPERPEDPCAGLY